MYVQNGMIYLICFIKQEILLKFNIVLIVYYTV